MKKIINLKLLIVAAFTFLVFSCSKEENGISEKSNEQIVKRSSDCTRSISFVKKITKYVSFDATDDQLTLGEKTLKIPKTDIQHFKFCESDGTIRTTVDYKSRILGAPRKISWRSESIGDELTVYSQNGEVLSSSTLVNYESDFENILLTYESTLIPEEEYDYFIESMRQNMEVEDISNDIIAVSTATDEGLVKNYFDRRFQKEIAVENYDNTGDLVNRTSKIYEIDGNSVFLKTDTKLMFKQSPDSEKIMSLITASSYSYN